MNSKLISVEPTREGLNNQRIALFGLLAYAFENNLTPLLPCRCIDHIPKPLLNKLSLTSLPFYTSQLFKYYLKSKIFKPYIDIDKVFSFDPCLSLEQSACFSTPQISFKDALSVGFRSLSNILDKPYLKELFLSIRFSEHSCTLSDRVISSLCQSGEYNSVGLRLEYDWLRYIRSPHFPGRASEIQLYSPENFLVTMQKISDLTGVRKYYCCCDVNDFPIRLTDLKRMAKQVGLKLMFRSDFSDLIPEQASSLLASAIDYQVSLKSRAYLGSTRSTFSNLLALEASLLNFSWHADFIMNKDFGSLHQRCDRGLSSDPFANPI